MKNFKNKLLDFAEILDAFRVVPRLILLAYGWLVFALFQWFTNIETHLQTECDPGIFKILQDQGLPLAEIQMFACSTVDTVGGPTTAQTSFVTVVVGLASAVIGFYVSTGKKWGDDKNRKITEYKEIKKELESDNN